MTSAAALKCIRIYVAIAAFTAIEASIRWGFLGTLLSITLMVIGGNIFMWIIDRMQDTPND